ncbi:hypothetical protein CR513_09167, partial [Mucuna pruriens]
MKATVERSEGPIQELVNIHALWRQSFSEEINRTPILANFQELVVDPFDGTQDPRVHLQAFQTQMYISGGVMPLAVNFSLRSVHAMIVEAPARTIQSFKDLAFLFISQFATNRAKWLEVVDLFDIRQTKGKNLKSYLARFNNVTVWHGGDKDASKKTHRSQGGLGRPTRSRMLTFSVPRVEDTGSKPGHVTTTPNPFYPIEGEEGTNTTRGMSYPVAGILENNERSNDGAKTRRVNKDEGTYENQRTTEKEVKEGQRQNGWDDTRRGERPRERSRSRERPNTLHKGTIATISEGSTKVIRAASAN